MAPARRAVSAGGPALARRRLASQRLLGAEERSALGLVRAMGAVQAQDYPGGLWAVGLRLGTADESEVERAIDRGELVRTWPMRRTLHLVPAADVRWMLRLLNPRQLALSAGRHRQLGLAAEDFARARHVLTRALQGGRRLTRAAAYDALRGGGVSPDGQRGIHVLADLAQQGMLCCGPREGKQPTFVLLEEWVTSHAEPERDEALATLASRYFGGHGPATVHDFAWWSGLTVGDARRAVGAAGARLVEERHDGVAHWALAGAAVPGRGRRPAAALLPPWDEYLVAYRDRAFATTRLAAAESRGVGLIGKPLVIVDGSVRGAWRRTVHGREVRISLDLRGALTVAERDAVDAAVARYRRFLLGDGPAARS